MSTSPATTALPVARVLVDTGLAHLDRTFDYAVPEELAGQAQPGARVKVRFAGQDLPGYVVERLAQADHEGRLSPLRTVVSAEAVLTPAVLTLARDLAATHAGTVGDVLRLAIPGRHARAEKALSQEAPVQAELPDPSSGAAWRPYPSGAALLQRLRAGESPAAAWTALPPGGRAEFAWPQAIAEAVAHCVAGGRGAVVVVPDHRDVTRLENAVSKVLGPGRHVRLTADQGPQARYTAWLKVLRGHVPVAIGTRAAAYAPVRDLGLIVVWDDGDDLHEEPRAPYVHVRDIAVNRARIESAALILGAHGRSVPVANLVQAGVLADVRARRSTVREFAPRVLVAGSERERERDPAAAAARLPTLAWRTAKTALAQGPVLVQVPRRGYVPALACQSCRARARCAQCAGPLGLAGREAVPTCRWCGRQARDHACVDCRDTRLRSLVIGARRTAEELGRSFPGVPVITSGAGEVLAQVEQRPALVIATPGAEPVVDGGYAAGLVLDAWALLDRAVLDAAPEALRRWLGAAALVRSAPDGGQVVVVGAPSEMAVPAVQALVRWDPDWLARRELAERAALRLPPATVFAEVTGPRQVLEGIDRRADFPALVRAFGPTPQPDPSGGQATPAIRAGGGSAPASGRGPETGPAWRLLLRSEPPQAEALSAMLRRLKAERSARKEKETVRVRVGVGEVD